MYYIKLVQFKDGTELEKLLLKVSILIYVCIETFYITMFIYVHR